MSKLPAHYDSLAATRGNPANFVALSPVSFLSRTADVYPEYTSLVYEDQRFNWAQTQARCQAMAHALRSLGVEDFDTVSLLCFNTPEMFEAHYFVPLARAVINTINTRLDPQTIAYILDFAKCKVLIVDRELLPSALPGLQALKDAGSCPKIILIDDPHANQAPALPDDFSLIDYQDLLTEHALEPSAYVAGLPNDELDPLAINFTSGTSGRPKGVVYHHRGSYLMAMGTVAGWSVPRHANYLYSVPMFHCNGWGHAWTMTLMAATITCLRYIDPARIFQLMANNNISHFGGAPIVLNMLANSTDCPDRLNPNAEVSCMTAGAPPPAAVLGKMADLGCDVMHVYGLTETYGHILQGTPQRAWNTLSSEAVAEHKSRQGVRFPMTQAVAVLDEQGEPVPADGLSMGEIVVRGNTVMSGYLRNPEATAEVLHDGWFYSGDLAVVHEDGYIQVKDRAKDIIISGGENISSVEVEDALYKHPAVAEAAVVAMPDEQWGERPCAFVELKAGAQADEAALIEHCLQYMARFKRPSKVVFGALPKTATGKIQKYELRKRVRD